MAKHKSGELRCPATALIASEKSLCILHGQVFVMTVYCFRKSKLEDLPLVRQDKEFEMHTETQRG